MFSEETCLKLLKLNNNILKLGKGDRSKGLAILKEKYASAYNSLAREILEETFPVIHKTAAKGLYVRDIDAIRKVQDDLRPLFKAALIEYCNMDMVKKLTEQMRIAYTEISNHDIDAWRKAGAA